jgi:hypothetical protein
MLFLGFSVIFMTFFISGNERYRNGLVAASPDDCGNGFEINKIGPAKAGK